MGLNQHADLWRLAMAPNVHKNMFITKCCPTIPVILTVDFSSTLTSYLLVVLATFPMDLLPLLPLLKLPAPPSLKQHSLNPSLWLRLLPSLLFLVIYLKFYLKPK